MQLISAGPRYRDAPEVISDPASLGSAAGPSRGRWAVGCSSHEHLLLLSGTREQIFAANGTGVLPCEMRGHERMILSSFVVLHVRVVLPG